MRRSTSLILWKAVHREAFLQIVIVVAISDVEAAEAASSHDCTRTATRRRQWYFIIAR
jgi:hypothetical protein